ncbi:hypothetical protein [Bacillus marinisedimentorum]|uniref:hypothetical protein n=1 Tax=Bacillus marinisedimentorum TaxID=1821260 RepID=UPI00087242B4|nr:hypothetical protein [Bacillus marinisedimentorum]
MGRPMDERLLKWKDDLEREKKLIENQLRVAQVEIDTLRAKQVADLDPEDTLRKEQRFLNYKEAKHARLLNIDVLLDEIDVNRELRS